MLHGSVRQVAHIGFCDFLRPESTSTCTNHEREKVIVSPSGFEPLTFGFGGHVRFEAGRDRIGDVSPCNSSECGRLVSNGRLANDVADLLTLGCSATVILTEV